MAAIGAEVALPSLEAIETAGLALWPAEATALDGAWVLKASAGYTKRANSIESFDPADDSDALARLGRAADWFAERGLPPIFRVTPLAGPGILRALDALDWAELDPSLTLATQSIPPSEADAGIRLFPVGSPEFLSVQQQLWGYDQSTTVTLAKLLSRISTPAAGIVLYAPNDRPIGTALAGIANGIAGFGNVVVAKDSRGQGNGRVLMRAAFAWAWEQRAEAAAINVLASNTTAQALYRSLGFADHHAYAYRRAPQ